MERESKFNYDYLTVGVLYFLSYIYYKETFDVLNEGSRVFPRIISIVSVIFASLLLFRILILKANANYNFNGSNQIIVLTIFTVTYIFVMGYIGFYIATPIFLVLSFRYLKVNSKKVMILTPIIMDITVFVFFDYLFRIPIPVGSLIEPVIKVMSGS